MIKKKDISKKDIEVWNNYIKDPQDIVDKDALSQKKKSNETIKIQVRFARLYFA